jgi:hypothetical protein
MENEAEPAAPPRDYDGTRSSKFRFKSRRPRDHDQHDGHDDDERRRKRRKHGHSSSHRSHRSRREHSNHGKLDDDPSTYDDTYLPNSRTSGYLDPEAAFRESLFDALADDEGAAYWEGVYGQPIHVYPNTKAGPEGELEQMTEEEYASHVRMRMWEKTHEHILEERRRRDEARKKQREADAKLEHEEEQHDRFESQIEKALRRGEKRKKERQWKDAWSRYSSKWEKMLEEASKGKYEDLPTDSIGALIPWPVLSGHRKDVSSEEVKAFFERTAPGELHGILKAERVRWHPDKMQHRISAIANDQPSLQAVTAVFQIIDTMWAALRSD